MLGKNTIIHIMDSCDKILFDRDDAQIIHFILETASERQANRCYSAFLSEIARQCGKR